ncbi:MAG TPA: hypothetical protein VN372_06975 [Methanospirillum sp.]|nr:hypothetical protein [Methanospirillum sp.]
MKQKDSQEPGFDFLSTLTDNQAHLVLIHLLRDNPSLTDEAVAIARDLISGIDEEEIADQVCSALSDLDVHQLWEESGGKHDGYVDPYEHSYTMMEEIIEPYCDEMERYLDREMQGEARAFCRGIIRGVCVYMHEEGGEFADWAVDNEDGLTYDVIERWKEKCPDPDLIRDMELFRVHCLSGEE